MQGMPRLNFPAGSLLVAMLGEQAPMDVRRAARRLRAEGAPALAIDDEIARLARELAGAEVSCSPGVLDVLPPLFWLETSWEDTAGAAGIQGWIVEKKRGGLAVQRFIMALSPESLPEGGERTTIAFGAAVPEEDAQARLARGMVTAVSLPQMMAQMGESSPVMLIPADGSDQDAGILRGFRLAVATSPDSLPG